VQKIQGIESRSEVTIASLTRSLLVTKSHVMIRVVENLLSLKEEQYSLIVLKVPLNSNQPTCHSKSLKVVRIYTGK